LDAPTQFACFKPNASTLELANDVSEDVFGTGQIRVYGYPAGLPVTQATEHREPEQRVLREWRSRLEAGGAKIGPDEVGVLVGQTYKELEDFNSILPVVLSQFHRETPFRGANP